MRKAMLFLLTLLTLPAYAFELKPFTASYTADWKQMPISGNASRSLKALGDGRWQLDFEASMLLASLNEVSTFKVENDTFLPQTYRFARQGLGKGKQIELDFDWSQKQVLGSDRGDAVRQPLNRGQLDKSTYQLVLQHDVADGKKSMSYQIIEGEDVDTYDFRVLGEEKVRTQAGLINAIKVERVRDPGKSNRKTIPLVRQGLGLPAGPPVPDGNRRQGIPDHAQGRHHRRQDRHWRKELIPLPRKAGPLPGFYCPRISRRPGARGRSVRHRHRSTAPRLDRRRANPHAVDGTGRTDKGRNQAHPPDAG